MSHKEDHHRLTALCFHPHGYPTQSRMRLQSLQKGLYESHREGKSGTRSHSSLKGKMEVARQELRGLQVRAMCRQGRAGARAEGSAGASNVQAGRSNGRTC